MNGTWVSIAPSFVAVVAGEHVVRSANVEGGPGMVDRLASAAADAIDGEPFDAVAVLVGPGSFTGLRAGLALAHGLSVGRGVALVGATVGEAIRFGLGWSGRLWVVSDTRRGTAYLEGDGPARSVALDAIAPADPTPLLAGDLAADLAERLGIEAEVADPPLPGPLGLVRAARARHKGMLDPLPVLPLYIDTAATSRSSPERPPPA